MKIKVLLLKDVAWVWWKWEIKEVSDAYARNVLIKQNIWKIADQKAVKDYEKKQKEKAQELKTQQEQQSVAISKMQEEWLKIEVSAAVDGHLYEKIDVKHIRDEILKQHKAEFTEKEIKFLDKKVNKTGFYDFDLIKDWKKISLKLNILTK